MNPLVTITKTDMDLLLQPENGWHRTSKTVEYFYERKVNGVSIFVQSSVLTKTGRSVQGGPIRIFAIGYVGDTNFMIAKPVCIKPSKGWEGRLKQRYKDTVARINRNQTVLSGV